MTNSKSDDTCGHASLVENVRKGLLPCGGCHWHTCAYCFPEMVSRVNKEVE